MNNRPDTEYCRSWLPLALIWLLLVPAIPGLLPGGTALADEATGRETDPWSPLALWSETPVDIYWPLRLDPDAWSGGEAATDPDELAERFPSTYPPQGLCTNFSGLGFQRQGILADSRPWFQPTTDNFPYMITDDRAPGIDDILRYIEGIESRTYQGRKYTVRILNDIEQVNRSGLDPRLQIVVNHVINYGPQQEGHSCFTLYFPPYFKAYGFSEVELTDTGSSGSTGLTGTSPVKALDLGERYPILLQANGWGASNNLSFKSNGSGGGNGTDAFSNNPAPGYYPSAVLDGYEHDGHGFIYVQSNGGGLGSIGHTREYLKDLAWMIHRLHTGFHCDRSRVVTVGSSRGGGVALMAAINPYAGDPDFPQPYNVLGIFSRVPPLGAGTMSQTPITVNPTINALYNAELGSGADRYSHDPPPLSNPAPVLDAPLGTTDVNLANDLSPDGLLVENLQGKFVFFMHGTQDSWMSERHWIGFERWLSMNGVAHSSVTVLNTGHGLPSSVGGWQTVFGDFVRLVLDDPNLDPSTYVPPDTGHGTFENARDYYWKGDLDQVVMWDNVYRLDNQATLPFSATLPYRIGRVVNSEPPGANHEPGCIELHGTAGRAWRVEIADQTGPLPAPWGVMEGTFGGIGQIGVFVETVHLCWGYEGLPRIDTAEHYEYTIWYEDLNGVMQDVSSFTNYELTPGERIRPITRVTESQPYPADPIEGYYPAHNANGKAYMMSLGINWCETCPQQ